MKTLRLLLIGLFAVLPLLYAASVEADGKATFEKYKCNACHSVTGQGIQKASGEAAPPAEPGEEGAKSTAPPDLSNVGAKRDAAWIKGWIEKTNDIDGRKHKKRWTGKPEELDELVTWLAGLKQAPK